MIVLYDSHCGFCVSFVRFFEGRIKDDQDYKKHDLRTREARAVLREKEVAIVNLNTIYLVDNGVHMKSRAVFRILRHARFPYNLAFGLSMLPAPLTDIGYDFIARNRYKISRFFPKLG
jgi:predicted DCC family thiol-disulfide oxidoreductase YuxK